MSGSIKSTASEELLSSLKRIVSEEPTQKDSVKLVLTPSQRVGLDPKPPAPRPLILSHSLEAKVTQLEEIIARTDDEWEPDGDDDSDYAGGVTSTLDWERVADAAHDEFDTVLPKIADEETENISDKVSEVDPLIDDEINALKEFVAKVVRQELNSHLGEKVTAKIRRMVQHEIKAVLEEYSK